MGDLLYEAQRLTFRAWLASTQSWTERRWLPAVFFLALALSLAMSYGTGRFGTPERWEYSEIADNVVQGRGAFHEYLGAKYYFYGPPTYPFLLAAVLGPLHGSESLMLVVQAFLFAGSAALVYRIARTWFAPGLAGVSGLLAACHPGNLVYSGKLHAQTLDIVLLLAGFLMALRLTHRSNAWAGLGAGCLLGSAALSRGTVVPFYVCWVLLFLYRERNRWSQALRVVGAITLGAVLVIGPQMTRAYLRYGALIPLRTDTGVNLWLGNHVGATGTAHSFGPDHAEVFLEWSRDVSPSVLTMNEVEQSRAFVSAVSRFVVNDPGAFVILWLKKLYYFWWFSPSTGLLYRASWLYSYGTFYALVLFFAALGLSKCVTSESPAMRQGTQVFVMLAVTFSVTQALFYVEGRHRWQIEPLLFVFVPSGILMLKIAAQGLFAIDGPGVVRARATDLWRAALSPAFTSDQAAAED